MGKAADADPPEWKSSVEAKLSAADLVVLGEVEAIHREAPAFGSEWYGVTIHASETLKGTAPSALEFGGSVSEIGALTHAARAEKFLFCLVKGNRRLLDNPAYGRFDWALSEGYLSPGGALFALNQPVASGAAPLALVYTVDNAPICDGDELLRYARDYCVTTAGSKSKLFGFEMKVSRSASPSIMDDPILFIVPLDARTEQHAREWSRSSDPARRWNAILVLSQYANSANIDLLKSMLGDPAFFETGQGRTRARYYYIRAKASEVLQISNIPAKTQVEEAFLNYRPVP